MQINVSFDSQTLQNAPAGYFTAINYVVNLFDTTFTNNVTVNIEADWGEGDGLDELRLEAFESMARLTEQDIEGHVSLDTGSANVSKNHGTFALRVRGDSMIGAHILDGDVVILEVTDFGKGIPEERLQQLRQVSAQTGVGLAGMRERLHELNGKLEIESDARGTCMRATVPLYAMSHPDPMEVCGTMSASAQA